jgi:hypothetical protein
MVWIIWNNDSDDKLDIGISWKSLQRFEWLEFISIYLRNRIDNIIKNIDEIIVLNEGLIQRIFN